MTDAKTSTVGAAAAGMAGDEAFLTKEEVAARLRKPMSTIEEWMGKKILPFYRIERSPRFRWSEIQAVFAARYRVAAFDEAQTGGNAETLKS